MTARKVLHPGDTSMATKDTTHYHRNVGKDSVILIAVEFSNLPSKAGNRGIRYGMSQSRRATVECISDDT